MPGPAFIAGSVPYASVGHGGVSAYLAVMGLAGTGGMTGFLPGLVGIGGVIFRRAPATVSAAFIAANSRSGLSGFIPRGGHIPVMARLLLPCALVGGWFGSRRGGGRTPVPAPRHAPAAAKFATI